MSLQSQGTSVNSRVAARHRWSLVQAHGGLEEVFGLGKLRNAARRNLAVITLHEGCPTDNGATANVTTGLTST